MAAGVVLIGTLQPLPSDRAISGPDITLGVGENPA
jgi:hypothetical protein